MLVFLRDKASERKLRLFAVACCRHIWHLIPDKPGHQAVEQAERYADGVVSRQQLAKVRRACSPRSYINRPLFERDNAWCAMIAVLGSVSNMVMELEVSAMALSMAYAGFSLIDAPDRSTPSIRQRSRNSGRKPTVIKPHCCARSSVTRFAR